MPSLAFDGKGDTLLEWGVLTEFQYFSEGAHTIGLLVVWNSDADAAQALAYADDMRVRIDPSFRRRTETAPYVPPPVWSLRGPAATLLPFIRRSIDHGLIERVELSAAASASTHPLREFKALRATTDVLVGVMDDGFGYANARFLRPDGTPRCVWLWDQDPASPGAPLDLAGGPGTLTFNYGGQWSRDDLAAALAAADGPDGAYRALGLRSLRRSVTHGTHVTDLIAGNRAGDSHPFDDCDMVLVQFPRSGIEDPSGGWLDLSVRDGLDYIRAAAGPAVKSIVVNVSWGPQTGPHDGHGALEDAFRQAIFDENLRGRRLIITMPSGNSFASRAHASADAADGLDVEWVVPPDGSTPAHVEFWWPTRYTKADCAMTITAPDGSVTTIDATTPDSLPLPRFQVIKESFASSGPTLRLVINPVSKQADASHGLQGRWLLSVPAIAGGEGEVHAYIARADHNLGGKRRAKASYFTDRAYEAGRFVAPSRRDEERLSSVVRHRSTLNDAGCGPTPYLAGGYSHADLRPAPYTSSGPTRGWRSQPDYSCVTDRSLTRPGIHATGVRSGTRVRLIGTSTAAPLLAREIVRATLDCYPDQPGDDRFRLGTARFRPDRSVLDHGER